MKTTTKDRTERPPKYDKNWRPIYPLKRVTRSEFWQSKYSRSGHGTNAFWLECGHQAFAKYSQGCPSHKRCRECWQEQNGVKITHPKP